MVEFDQLAHVPFQTWRGIIMTEAGERNDSAWGD